MKIVLIWKLYSSKTQESIEIWKRKVSKGESTLDSVHMG
jgi:hypothetical protein